eukprot:549244-Hanusia_phi.AAC.1
MQELQRLSEKFLTVLDTKQEEHDFQLNELRRWWETQGEKQNGLYKEAQSREQEARRREEEARAKLSVLEESISSLQDQNAKLHRIMEQLEQLRVLGHEHPDESSAAKVGQETLRRELEAVKKRCEELSMNESLAVMREEETRRSFSSLQKQFTDFLLTLDTDVLEAGLRRSQQATPAWNSSSIHVRESALVSPYTETAGAGREVGGGELEGFSIDLFPRETTTAAVARPAGAPGGAAEEDRGLDEDMQRLEELVEGLRGL